MRVVILVAGLPPAYTGGSEMSAMRLAKHAARMGHEMHIVTMGRCSTTVEGVSVHGAATVGLRYLRGLCYIPDMLRIVHRVRPDIVHTQSIYTAPGAVAARKVLGVPYLLYERGSVDMNIGMFKRLYRPVMEYASRVIAQTEAQRLSLLRLYRREIEVIPNGVDVTEFGNTPKTQARDMLRLPQQAKIALFVGRFRPEKRACDFIAATSTLNGVTAILVGDGPQMAELKAMASPDTIFTGALGTKEVALYMCAADMLVNTSSSEGFPVAVLEGMASGLPIVAPKVCGIPEIVEHGVNGYLVDPSDHELTAMMIRLLLMNKHVARSMAKANRAKAEAYTWENVVRRLYGCVVSAECSVVSTGTASQV